MVCNVIPLCMFYLLFPQDANGVDVTKFLDEHPGGDIILDGAGIDATQYFNDTGHSSDAVRQMKNWYIGDVKK